MTLNEYSGFKHQYMHEKPTLNAITLYFFMTGM